VKVVGGRVKHLDSNEFPGPVGLLHAFRTRPVERVRKNRAPSFWGARAIAFEQTKSTRGRQ
jgi:hypothetical protein